VRLERPLFDSRLARRVFATFLLASLVPLLALAFLLLQEVGRALEDQAFKQLENTTRSYGQFTLDKMLFAGDSLQEGVALATSAASTSPFDAVTLVDHGEQRPLVGAWEPPLGPVVLEQSKPTLLVTSSPGGTEIVVVSRSGTGAIYAR